MFPERGTNPTFDFRFDFYCCQSIIVKHWRSVHWIYDFYGIQNDSIYASRTFLFIVSWIMAIVYNFSYILSSEAIKGSFLVTFCTLKKNSWDHLGWETPCSIPFMVTNYPRIELSTTTVSISTTVNSAFTALQFIRSLCYRLLFKGIVLQSAIMSCDMVY